MVGTTRTDQQASARAAANAVADDLAAGLGRDPDAPSFSLAFAEAGFALLFHAVGRDAEARDLLSTAARGVNESRPGASLYVGWGGVALATCIVCGRDETARSQERALAALRRGVCAEPWRGRLDLTDGLAGLVALALALLPHPDAAATVAGAVVRFDDLAEQVGPGVAWASRDDPGRFDVGVAHGAAGILLALVAAHEAGIERERSARLLDGAVDWLLSLEGAGRRFPDFAPPAPSSPMPNAWCWGDVGVALAIARAARARDRPDWRDAAVAAAVAAGSREPAELGVGDASFCHGSAGVAHTLRALHAATADERLAGLAQSWADRALASREPGTGIGGFRTAAYPWHPERGLEPDASLQIGATGTALALLAAAGLADTGWDRAFLVTPA